MIESIASTFDDLGRDDSCSAMRSALADRVKAETDHELSIQDQLRITENFKEGVKAMSERRVLNWRGS